MGNGSAPRSFTTLRAALTAAGSPSTAKGTSSSEGADPRTKVISGCTEATAAPRSRKPRSSSLANAPLECSATLPRQSTASESCRAAPAISRSGTQNQTRSPSRPSPGTTTLECASSASARPFLRDALLFPETMSLMRYPARVNSTASALPSLPGPTIAIRGLRTIAAA